jgi:phosphoadenosine phosphosulfate reductase
VLVLSCPPDFEADLEDAIEVIRANAPADRPYYGLFSGGKDSVALHEVSRMAGVAVEWHYNVTTIDPPELVRFIRREYPHVRFHRSSLGNFFRRAGDVKGFPTRTARWCCGEYKERTNPKGATLLMGIRAQESSRRAARWAHVQRHDRTGAPVVNPLLGWDTQDLWGFIHGADIPYCRLYDEGFHRLGCIGCPLANKASRQREFTRWPRYERRWQWVFQRTWERRTGTIQTRGKNRGKPWFGDVYFSGWREMWDWWLHDRPLPDSRQIDLGLEEV